MSKIRLSNRISKEKLSVFKSYVLYVFMNIVLLIFLLYIVELIYSDLMIRIIFSVPILFQVFLAYKTNKRINNRYTKTIFFTLIIYTIILFGLGTYELYFTPPMVGYDLFFYALEMQIYLQLSILIEMIIFVLIGDLKKKQLIGVIKLILKTVVFSVLLVTIEMGIEFLFIHFFDYRLNWWIYWVAVVISLMIPYSNPLVFYTFYNFQKEKARVSIT